MLKFCIKEESCILFLFEISSFSEARYSTVTPSAYAIFKAFSTLGED
ncbi:MAG: hypothetical protein L6V90_02745 [Treponema succinifaciens]|nr:MAG: hypothetical protein L6V90_02745 [Treponema succinifaciens]